jgi:predicted DsbA family dithiol-disulfide isomerase
MHHELFLLQAEAGQFSGERLNVGRFSGATLGTIARGLGLNTDAFLACFESVGTLSTVQDQQSAARAAGLTGTPGVLFNGTPIGGNPGTLENWRLLIEAALDELEMED